MNLLVRIVFLVLAYAVIANSHYISSQGQTDFMAIQLSRRVQDQEKNVVKHIIKKRDVEATKTQPLAHLNENINLPVETPTDKKSIKKDLHQNNGLNCTFIVLYINRFV